MKDVHELEILGVNVAEGLDRVMGDEDLYEMMLGMFVDMIDEYSIKMEEFDSNDLSSLIERIHTLKGTTGNLSITPLFTGYTKTLELLRSDQTKEAKDTYQKMLTVQSKILDCIKMHNIKE